MTASAIGAIHTGSLREQVVRALEAALVVGELKPGETYSAPALGQRFGVSATPVREAMLDLAKDGLVEVVRNKGFRVVDMSEADLDQISDIRFLLEVPSAAKVALSITSAQIDELAGIADEIVAAARDGDLIGYLDADRRFHVALISTLDNPRLTDIVDRLRRQTRLYGLNDLVQAGRLDSSAQEHRDNVEALRSGSAERVRELMGRHILHTRGLWVGRDEGP
jgi:DNA-binding GntR family transcriptional regulator